MGDDADQDALGLIAGSPDEETGEVYLGRRAPKALSNLDGPVEPQGPVERGPTPRSLAQARIQVRSEPHAPRVRSSKLQPRRHVRTGPNPLLEDTPLTPMSDATSSRVVPKTAPLLPDLEEEDDSPPAPKRRRLLEPLQVVSGLLLLETALMPSLRARNVVTPWSAWTDPASPNFVAVSFMALLAVFFAFPLSRFFRTALQGLTAVLLTVFSLVLLRSALASGLFDAQPALHALFIDGLTGGFVVIITVCVVSTALFWLHVVPESRRARACLIVGVALTLLTYFGLGPLTLMDDMPLTLLLGACTESLFAGDRLAALVALFPLVVVGLSMSIWLPGERGGLMGLLGALVWLLSTAPLIVLALFVASADNWQDVLVPLQIASLLTSAVLLIPASLGHVLAVHEVGEF